MNNMIKSPISEYLPPQAIEIEEAILGAIMIDSNSIIKVKSILKPESFYKQAHQKLYKSILELSSRDEQIDILTVTEELKRQGDLESVGGPYYVSQLTSRVASAVHIEFHARIVVQKFIQRELIRMSAEAQTMAYDDSLDVLDLLSKVQGDISNLIEDNIKKESPQFHQLIDQTLDQISEAGKRDDGICGVPSDFIALDRVTSGFQNSELIVIGGRPSMGKTAFVLTMVRNMAVDHKIPVAVFSLGMKDDKLVKRILSSESELGSEKLRSGNLESFEEEILSSRVEELKKAPIYIDDIADIDIKTLEIDCFRKKAKLNIECIVIDGIELIRSRGTYYGNQKDKLVEISKDLKRLAMKLNIPIVITSSLERGVEQRTGEAKSPMLVDLDSAYSLDVYADLILLLNRPDRYGITEDAEGNSLIGIADVFIAKHSNGACGEIQLRYRNQLARFTDLEGEISYSFGRESLEDVKTFSSSMNHPPKDYDSNFDDTPPF
ncbi:replicative DNA helicase [Labilibaculum sp. DW002]|uniref:Replicative DNA helicase n=1 Tax=Paralabilibaculum antarcticum TaxID=2912572 RepID=A0ABT5VSQ3_9BACT|nr:replicative DNA helicase [Labilibaculum sp. DW002]MDE5418459.1 replicative DNA helicase [Labilibaculum sp. DW002]